MCACVLYVQIFSAVCFSVILSVTGEDGKCDSTLTGPGSELCKPAYAWTNFQSAVFMFSVALGGGIWALFNVVSLVAASLAIADFCTGRFVELLQNCIDGIVAILNVMAFLAGAIEFTQAQADVNQGQSILDVTTDSDRVRFQLAIATCFFNFCNLSCSCLLFCRPANSFSCFSI